MTNLSLSKEEFSKFLNKLPALGLVKKRTGDNIRMAGNRLFKYIPDNVSADKWNIEKILNQFKSDNNSLTDTILASYRTRFKSAVKKFITYQTRLDTINHHTISVPIFLKQNRIVEIANLPVDLTIEEADKIRNILRAYAINGNVSLS